MRIQHNIMAMNSYRNYNNNTKALSANLEKLSSGYKINRAGDDAAGLAISEKMRAQITGLDAAQKNVKDGISLVKTAEGAMQEIQDMLKRMKYLATQSANGTYQNEVDRDNLNKEVTTLKAEINRIAESANFNGINLLDGSLSAQGGAGGGGSTADVAVTITGDKAAISDGTPAAQETEITFVDAGVDGSGAAGALKNGDKINITVEMTDGTKYSLDFTVSDDSGAQAKVEYNGEELTATATKAGVKAADIAKLVKEALETDDSFNEKYTAAESSGKLTLTSNTEAFGDPSIKVGSVSINGKTPVNAAGKISDGKEGKGEFQQFDTTAAQVYSASDADMKAEKSIFEVNGQKFAFAKDADSAKALGSDVNVVIGTTADADAMVALMNQKLGMNFEVDENTATTINMISKGGTDGGAGAGDPLTLQIGDTSDDYNKMKVSIGDMKTTAMGKAFTMKTDGEGVTTYDFSSGSTLDAISIGDAKSAADAIETIKNAINYVSSVRGDLGALQNRLDHTANNLSVMAENIQDAESTIRDTDVANEMMAYTKNNILIQSAQAMLAQANAVPQGVLQLLG